MHYNRWMMTLILILGALALTACGSTATGQTTTGQADARSPKVTLILGAYTTPREAYAKIIPLFQQHWKEKTGQEVVFQESYLGSGAQSRAVAGGFEADIVALSLEADINRISEAGLITHDWKQTPHNGMVSTSVVVIAVRKGNPKEIKDWHDLAASEVEILTPDPQTSGGAQWNVLAMYGAAQRGHVTGYAEGDENAAREFLKAVFKNVSVLDKGARESITNYEKGVGDVAITYENEVIVARKNGQDYEYVIPSSTILIENPVAIVDKYVDKHGTRQVAEAFRDFLWTPEAQRILAEFGLRSVDPAVATETKDQYPPIKDLFTIEHFGGWGQVTKPFFGEDGLYINMLEEIQEGQ